MTDTTLGIAGIGAYAPRYRLSADAVRHALDTFRASGIESVAVPDADEDPLTMAWEASKRALDAAGVDGAELGAIYLASTTLATLDESPVHHLATSFAAPEALDSRTFTGSAAACGDALASALEAPGDRPVLVVASDVPRGSQDSSIGHAAGSGAAAVVLTTDGDGAVDAHSTATRSYPGTRYRLASDDEGSRGLGITQYDREAYTETLRVALDGISTDGLDAAALTMSDGKLPYRAAGAVGLDTETVANAETVSSLGDTGAASALLGLANAATGEAQHVLLAAYGSGSTCHAFRLDVRAVPVSTALEGDVDVDYATAMRLRGVFSSGQPAGGGANVTTPTYRRSLPQRYRLLAGACRDCAELVFPPENACPHCGSRAGYEDTPLPPRGDIVATTVIGTGGAPPEFVDQQNRSGAYGTAIVRFSPEDDSRSVDVPLQVVLGDVDDAPAIGHRVTTVLRVLYDQQGVRRYGLKAVPDVDVD